MGYTLFAILAQLPLLEADPRWIADSRIIALEQDISMIPVTAALYDGFIQQYIKDPAEDWAGFVFSPAPLVTVLSQLSQRGTVAYVEADFFGGRGDQHCVVWRGGDIKLGPLNTKGRGAINKALSRLGAKRQPFRDEFEAVGLNRHRSNEDWLAAAE